MKDEEFVRRYILKVLKEETEKEDKGKEKGDNKEKDKEKGDEGEDKSLQKTTGPGPGRYKKELANLKALSDSNPKELMTNLGIGGGGGGEPEEILLRVMKQAAKGTAEMKAVYTNPQQKKDTFGRLGAFIALTGQLAPRDALAFIRETVKGAEKAGILKFNEKIQVEILGDGILAYISAKPFRWNQKKR